MSKSSSKGKKKPVKSRKISEPDTRSSVEKQSFWRSHWLPVLIITVLATLPYWQAISYEYVLDDKIVFTENQFVHKGVAGLGDIFGKESFVGYFGSQQDLLFGARYRPLSLATFALENELWGQSSRISHFLNILLYALNGLLLYVVLLFLLPATSSQKWFLALPFAATLLFVLHPIHSEVVANVKGRDEILTMLGALGTMHFSHQYIKDQRWKWLVGSGLTFFIALLAKENALTFLAVVPLGLLLFTSASRRQLISTTLPLAAAAVAYLVLRYSVIGYFFNPGGNEVTEVMNNPFYGLSTGERLATVFYTLGQYLKLLLIPYPLTHDYYPYQIPIMSWHEWQPIVSLLLHLGLLVLAVFSWRRKRILAYGILFYFVTLSIVSNVFFTVGTFMNERFIFISSTGFVLVLGWLIVDRLPAIFKQQGQFISVALLVATSLAYLAVTWARVPDWQNPYTLALSAAKYSPNSARANLFLGVAIYEREFVQETESQKKLALLNEIDFFVEKATEILPNYQPAQNFRAGIVGEIYKIDQDLNRLLSTFYEVMEYYPDGDNVSNYLKWLAGRGDPNGYFSAFAHRAGFELLMQQRQNYPLAIQVLNYGLQASPNNQQLKQDLGLTYRAMGNEAKAQEYLGAELQ